MSLHIWRGALTLLLCAGVEFCGSKCGHFSTEDEKQITCKQRVQLNHPGCGHLITKHCYEKTSSITCKKHCVKALQRGHQCDKKCGKECIKSENCKICIKIKKRKGKTTPRGRNKGTGRFQSCSEKEIRKDEICASSVCFAGHRECRG